MKYASNIKGQTWAEGLKINLFATSLSSDK